MGVGGRRTRGGAGVYVCFVVVFLLLRGVSVSAVYFLLPCFGTSSSVKFVLLIALCGSAGTYITNNLRHHLDAHLLDFVLLLENHLQDARTELCGANQRVAGQHFALLVDHLALSFVLGSTGVTLLDVGSHGLHGLGFLATTLGNFLLQLNVFRHDKHVAEIGEEKDQRLPELDLKGRCWVGPAKEQGEETEGEDVVARIARKWPPRQYEHLFGEDGAHADDKEDVEHGRADDGSKADIGLGQERANERSRELGRGATGLGELDWAV